MQAPRLGSKVPHEPRGGRADPTDIEEAAEIGRQTLAQLRLLDVREEGRVCTEEQRLTRFTHVPIELSRASKWFVSMMRMFSIDGSSPVMIGFAVVGENQFR